MGYCNMDFRGNLEVDGPEYITEAETHIGKMITPGSNIFFPGITSGGQELEGDYSGSRD